MNICVLGFGNVGSQLTRLWMAAGHSLTVGLRSGSEKEQAARNSGATVLTPALASQSAELIALALPWGAVESSLRDIGSQEGKVILDATNPLSKDLSIETPSAGSAAEQVASWSAGARVVKAFNTIGAAFYGNPAFDMLYCGDDAEGKQTVRTLIEDTKMRPVDVGPLRNARYLEHIAGLWIDLSVKGRIKGPFGFNLVTDSHS